ncbi:LysR family transcriptional regulator [Pigmentiphaga sp.]|uniref:LysR family transcriptional regulator n=1 Tax=Pigmentiphaga sp. TaxID=1977564 RepID=UPI00128B5EA9|nr:LysR family transcriptional regulator [Pigmentiphaga sp.]MPS25787.1 LysR family transcriptional regulator [Alcaligenaceae bacterium SAGV5]MPS54395.1 LysR family transcriptional regulator [Alcaligenaceae bacterium SAGV3]MPT58535.1 LysR family transcriptional regulator [Alcaligenaceae bacterium]
MQISQLRAFVAAVAAGGMGAGARSLGIAQPTLTRAIQQLEADLGATLLARGPAGMVLTQFGRQLLPHAQRIVRSHGKVHETSLQLAGDGTGEVCVAISAVPRWLLAPRAAVMLWERYPRVRLTLAEAVYPQVLHHFERGSIDFAICPAPIGTDQATLRVEPIPLQSHLAVAMRKDHAKARAKNLGELATCTWIASGPSTGLGLPEMFHAHGLDAPDCPLQCESVECALRFVADTDMLTLAPRLLIERGAQEGKLAPPLLGGLGGTVQICMLTPEERVLTPAAAFFRAALLRTAEERAS